MTASWRPFNMTDDEYKQHQVLVDGVPVWMRESIAGIIAVGFTNTDWILDQPLRLSYTRQSKRRFPAAEFRNSIKTALMSFQSYDDDDLLTMTDFLINYHGKEYANSFRAVLTEAGSKWTAAYNGKAWGLTARVDETVLQAAEKAMDSGTTAGQHLSRAWAEAYGRNADPSEAYRHSIKAVEAAVKPIVSPNDSGATLGKMAGQMAKDGDWSLPFKRDDSRKGSAETVVAMMRNLYAGQHDRHGDLPEMTTEVTAEEAQAAVTMAVTLVQWFTSGAIHRRS